MSAAERTFAIAELGEMCLVGLKPRELLKAYSTCKSIKKAIDLSPSLQRCLCFVQSSTPDSTKTSDLLKTTNPLLVSVFMSFRPGPMTVVDSRFSDYHSKSYLSRTPGTMRGLRRYTGLDLDGDVIVIRRSSALNATISPANDQSRYKMYLNTDPVTTTILVAQNGYRTHDCIKAACFTCKIAPRATFSVITRAFLALRKAIFAYEDVTLSLSFDEEKGVYLEASKDWDVVWKRCFHPELRSYLLDEPEAPELFFDLANDCVPVDCTGRITPYMAALF